MSIVQSSHSSDYPKKDAKRHRDKQEKLIREKLPAIIAEESIITRKKGKTIRVPIKMLEIPRFRPKGQGGSGGGGGVGQGTGGPGQEPGGQPGDGPGVDYIEAEFEIDEIIEMALQDLGLPNLKKKDRAEIETILGFKVSGTKRSGPWSLFVARKTAKEGMKRFWIYLRYLERETGRDELACFSALRQTDGILIDAMALLQDPGFQASYAVIEPFPIIETEDLRFRRVEPEISRETKAVVIAAQDVSGSMDTMKRYLVRMTLFWLVECLRKLYDRVEIRFINHHSDANLVSEEEFFHPRETGGTLVWKAYALANELIEKEYPMNEWNVYVFHFSDGEDFDPRQSMDETEKLIEKKINMFGYGETRPAGRGGSNQLLDAFVSRFMRFLSRQKIDGIDMVEGKEDFPFLASVITKREDVWPTLRQYLRKDRWSQ